jgi:DNA-binding MarR family transcriptional regulator
MAELHVHRRSLTASQRRVLTIVQRQQDGPDEYGHDAEGDLSLCTGNLTHTLRTLRKRGLLVSYAVREPDDYYTEVLISAAGREALK